MSKAPDGFVFERPEDVNPLLRWREYLGIVRERMWVGLCTVLVIVVSVVLWNVRQTPMYRSTSRLQVDMSPDRILNIPDISGQGAPGYMFGQYINTLVKALRSRMFMQEVVESLRESDDETARMFLAATPSPVGVIQGSTRISALADSLLIEIAVEHPEAEVTALLANTIAEQFIEQDLRRREKKSMAAVDWLNQQAETQKARVTAAEMALQEYRERTGMVSLEQNQDTVSAKLRTINESLTAAETKLTVAESQWRDAKTMAEAGTSLEDVAAIAADPLVAAAARAVSEKEAELTSLSLRYKGKHPTLIAATTAVADAQASFKKACSDAMERIQREYDLARSNVQGLQRSLAEQEKKALDLSRVMVEYNDLKRNAEADQKLYEGLIQRMKETDLSGKLETTNIRINDKAGVPGQPFRPQTMKNGLRAAAAGLVLGIMLMFVIHLMDDRVRQVTDVERMLALPVLAMIPKIGLDSPRARATVCSVDSDSQPAEAFRGLRASMLLNPVAAKAKVIMVVSASAAEGKSLVASNMAGMLAMNGEHTLLMDADLRRPSVHRLFDLKGQKGLPHLLAGEAEWEDVVINIEHTACDLICASGAPSMPAQLLASEAMKSIIHEARSRYDRVIMDCPPLFGVSDPLLLLNEVDGIILVARYNQTHRRALVEASNMLLEGGKPILGVVINDMEMRSHSYYYYSRGYTQYYARRVDDDWPEEENG